MAEEQQRRRRTRTQAVHDAPVNMEQHPSSAETPRERPQAPVSAQSFQQMRQNMKAEAAKQPPRPVQTHPKEEQRTAEQPRPTAAAPQPAVRYQPPAAAAMPGSWSQVPDRPEVTQPRRTESAGASARQGIYQTGSQGYHPVYQTGSQRMTGGIPRTGAQAPVGYPNQTGSFQGQSGQMPPQYYEQMQMQLNMGATAPGQPQGQPPVQGTYPMQGQIPAQGPFQPQNQMPPQSRPVQNQVPPQEPPQPMRGTEGKNGAGRSSGQPMQNGYVPPKPPKPPRPPVQFDFGKLIRIVSLAAAVAVIVAGVAVMARNTAEKREMEAYVASGDQVFCQGVMVDGIDLSGMTWEEGYMAVTERAQQRNAEWSVNLTYQGQVVTTLSAGQLGMIVDIQDVMYTAWGQGKNGTLEERYDAMQALAVNGWQGYTALPNGDTSIVDSVLQQIKDNLYVAPQDAVLLSFDPELSYPFTFQDEVVGRTLNTEPLKQQIYRMVSTMESGDVEIVPDYIQPNVTVADLKQHLAVRAAVYTPISSASTENRTNNIRRCFQIISGYVLNPGSTFSFNKVVGKRSLANGFFEAIEYAYGEEVMGVGGGTCQASTTLYQAAVMAGLDIVDRSPHSDAVSYAKYGEDATVNLEGREIDLKFKNTTDGPIYIVCAVQSDPSNRKRFIARVTMYGEDLGATRYELYSETVEILEPPVDPVYVKDTNAEYVIYNDQEKEVSKPKEGYVVESYRIVYENDVEVSRRKLYTDTYKAKPAKIYVGVTKRDK